MRMSNDGMTSGCPDLRDFKSVLIVKPSSLGDIVHALPAVKAIRAAHPHLKLRWLVNTEWMPLLQGSPLVDEVLEFPRRRFRGLAGILRFWNWRRDWMRLPREEPEMVLDFQGLLRSGLVSRWRGSERVIGLSDAREGAGFFYSHSVPVKAEAHAVDRYLEMPRALGIQVDEAAFELPEGAPPAGAELLDWQQTVVVHPWSRGVGKSLSADALQALCEGLRPMRVALAGMTSDAARPSGEHVVDFSNRTSLPELVWMMRRARGCVSVDSGPMHIAAAVNAHTLGLHTWSDPRKVGPYPAASWVWKAGRIAHRHELTAEQCAEARSITAADAREIGEVAQKLFTPCRR
jgi:heptosyltransferase I